jgi:hypothetical protein
MNEILTINLKEPVIWEEKNLIEPEKKSENKAELEPTGSTIIIGKEYHPNEWRSIIKDGITGIYKITNKVNGKYYMGRAKNLNDRWRNHYNLLLKNNHGNRYLQREWNKYKANAFRFILVEQVSFEKLYSTDQKYLDMAKQDKKYVYNMVFISEGGEMTDDMKKVISEKAVKRYRENPKLKSEISRKAKERHKNNPSHLNKLSEDNRHRFSGNGNPNSDHLIYTFFNVVTDDIFEGTRVDFYTKHNFNSTAICELINKKTKFIKNWCILPDKQILSDIAFMLKLKASVRNTHISHSFYNVDTGEKFTGTPSEFRKRYNLKSTSISNLIKKRNKSYRRWIVIY